jgi:type IV secretion system protein VirB5
MNLKKIVLPLLLCTGLTVSVNSYASEFSAIMGILAKTYGVDIDMQDIQGVMQGLSEDQLDAIIGNYGYGTINNSNKDLKDREWSPESWDDALKGLSGGNDQRYQELLSAYQEDHPSLSQDDFSKGSSDVYATDYQQMVATNQAANVHASYAFEEVNEHLETIKKLSDEIEHTDNQKAISDLNARINTEEAYLQVEQIKAISVMNEQLAQGQASEIVSRSEASKFNQIPEE